VPIVLDKLRHLRYTLRTIRKIREEFGADAIEDGVPAALLGKFVWYGLTHEDPDLSLEQVEEMVDGQNLEEVSNALLAAFGQKPTVNPPSATGVADAPVADAPSPASPDMST